MAVSPLDVLASVISQTDTDAGTQVVTCTNDRVHTRPSRRRSRNRPDGEPIAHPGARQWSADDRIRHAVRRIHEQEAAVIDMRTEARRAFLFPARVTYPDPTNVQQLSALGTPPAVQEINMDVVLTDLSPEGAGILVSARHEPLPRRVSLVVDDCIFVCHVRWTKHVGGSVYRYGLVFRAVRRPALPKSPVDVISPCAWD